MMLMDCFNYGGSKSFTPSLATKNGNWVSPSNSTWVTVPGWTADAVSTVSGNGVAVSGNEANAVLVGRLHTTISSGALNLSVRLLLDGVVIKTLTDIPMEGYSSVLTSIRSDPIAVSPGQVVTMQINSQYAGYITFNGGANTLLGISTSVPAIPRGMIKTVKTSIQSSTFAIIPNMAANANLPGSVLSGDALVSDYFGPTRLACNSDLENPSNENAFLAVFVNGVQAGEVATGSVNYNGYRNLWTSSEIVVALGDLITMRFRTGGAAYATQINATTTRLNMSPYLFVPQGGTTVADQNPLNGFQDIIFPADPGTTMSGASIVVARDHPNAIITAHVAVRSDSTSSARILVNGNVVVTGPNIPGYDTRGRVSIGYPLAAGDLVKLQWNANSNYARTVYAGSKFAII